MIANPAEYTRGIIAVERAMHEIRQGRPVRVKSGADSLVLASPETADFEALKKLTQGKPLTLVITAMRARRLGLKLADALPVRLALGAAVTGDEVQAIINPLLSVNVKTETDANISALDGVALQLAKEARLLPAMLLLPACSETSFDVLEVEAAAIRSYQEALAAQIEPVSEARVPLAQAPDAKVVAFRAAHSAVEHLAIVVGDITKQAAPLTRVHSSCITGDILGSLRCDCGDQLRKALADMHAAGGGVLLYLFQEGRGIGIANKLKAYALQDGGRDTVDANEEMGFDADERTFLVAASMLRRLGISTVRLMTNNPKKVEEITRHGITVESRVPVVVPPNAHNAAYLDAKAKRCGHLL